jgi:hypothetical protein
MQNLIPRAERAGRLLKERGETIVVAESSTGGLISAALLAMPGASAYFLGGAVVYTQTARHALMDIGDLTALGMRATGSRRPGAWPKVARPVRRAIVMATRPDIVALRSLGQSSARSQSRPAAATA